MLILGLNKTTLLDYPGHVASTVFTGGCNFSCPFCHNKDLVLVNEAIINSSVVRYSDDDILSFLKKRKGIISGVCISGGEPTLQKDIIPFLSRIKELDLLIKLDTNGYSPDTLNTLIENDLIDYVAMDIKNSPDKYAKTVGIDSLDISIIQSSIDCLYDNLSKIEFEFRTTIVKEFHDRNDMYVISNWIKNAPHYFLQSYEDSGRTILPGLHPHDEQTLYSFLDICRENIPNTELRGID